MRLVLAFESEERAWAKVGRRGAWRMLGDYPVSLLAWLGPRRCIEVPHADAIIGC